MPKLSEVEIADRSKELAGLIMKKSDEKARFARKTKAHSLEVKRIEQRIDLLAIVVTSGYADDVQEALPGVQAGSGPDSPEQSAENAATFLDDLRDPDADDTAPNGEAPEGVVTLEYTRGWDAFNNNVPLDGNPHHNHGGQHNAIMRAQWNEGWEAAEEEATRPADA